MPEPVARINVESNRVRNSELPQLENWEHWAMVVWDCSILKNSFHFDMQSEDSGLHLSGKDFAINTLMDSDL
jgi:hypothetical protein